MSINERTQLISAEEAERLIDVIEAKCKVLYCTVARLYQNNGGVWKYMYTGIVGLTKDNGRKKYFLEMYCLENKTKCWEQLIPINFNYNVYKKQIHTFTSNDIPTLLSFASVEDSNKFSEEVRKLLIQRKEQKDAKKRQSQMNNQFSTTDNVVEMKPYNKPQPKNVQGKKVKLSKNDISVPTNFRHVDHMGLHDHFFENPEDENLRNFLKSAKMENLLDNADTKRDLYEFIEQKGGLKKLESEMRQQQQMPSRKAPPVPQKVPPPPPGRTPNMAPPSQGHKPPPPPGPMAPPPPVSGVAPPPPPPPPPPPAPGPPLSIPKPSVAAAASLPPPKVGLLAEIEKFDAKKLKARAQADAEDVATPPPAVGGSLLDSLAQYLVQRKTLLTGTSDSEAEDDNDEDEEDWKD